MEQSGVAIGELSRRTGCNIETIRYYERIGLLPIPARRGRYRLFDDEDIGRLRFVRRARELGFTLNEVGALLKLGSGACAEVHGIAAAHLVDVRSRIADLQAMERVLDDAVQQCQSGEKATCPLIDALSGTMATTWSQREKPMG
jgi:MerR family mercuric resistance operon transcriptional regulator